MVIQVLILGPMSVVVSISLPTLIAFSSLTIVESRLMCKRGISMLT